METTPSPGGEASLYAPVTVDEAAWVEVASLSTPGNADPDNSYTTYTFDFPQNDLTSNSDAVAPSLRNSAPLPLSPRQNTPTRVNDEANGCPLDLEQLLTHDASVAEPHVKALSSFLRPDHHLQPFDSQPDAAFLVDESLNFNQGVGGMESTVHTLEIDHPAPSLCSWAEWPLSSYIVSGIMEYAVETRDDQSPSPVRANQVGPQVLDLRAHAVVLGHVRNRLDGMADHPNALDEFALRCLILRFFKCFNNHLPLFHVPSFDASNAPTPLILAMCSIGALYHLERENAMFLRTATRYLIAKAPPYKSCSRPLWELQSELLLTFSFVFGGKFSDGQAAVDRVGILRGEYSARRINMLCKNKPPDTWSKWVRWESIKRLLYGIFIASNLLSSTFGIPAGFSSTTDLELDLPEEDALWNAASESQWKTLVMSKERATPLTASEALHWILSDKDSSKLIDLVRRPFATTVLLHAVSVYFWYAGQTLSPFPDQVVAQSGSSPSGICVEAILNRCGTLLIPGYQKEQLDGGLTTMDRPLLFSAGGLLRACFIRVAVSSNATLLKNVFLMTEEETRVLEAINKYIHVSAVQQNTGFTNTVIQQSISGLKMTYRMGYKSMQKTGPFMFSIDTPITAWDCALFSTKWVHSVQKNMRHWSLGCVQQQIIDEVIRLVGQLTGQRVDPTERSIAAELTRVWVPLFDDTFVWEITFRMGKLLRLLADAYEDDWNNKDD